MKLGPLLLGFILLNVLLFVFGIVGIETSTTAIFIDGGSGWGDFFKENLLINAAGIVIVGLAGAGIILKNNYMIFAGICGFIFTYGLTILPIVEKIGHAPFGQMIYALLMFLLFWIVLEWWRMTDN